MMNRKELAWIMTGLLGVGQIAAVAQAGVVVYPAPQGAPVSTDYAVTVDGKDLAIYGVPTRYGSSPACFSYLDMSDPVTISVTVNFLSDDAITNVSVHPLSLGITAQREGNRFTFKASHPGSVTLLVNGDHKNRPLHLFLSPPAEAPPKDALVFGPGKHVLGYDNPITLTNGQALYIAGGAWVEGIVRAKDARNIRIMGRGVLCQSQAKGKDYQGAETAPQGIGLADCQDVEISGIVLARAIGGWCGYVANCDRVVVRDYHVLAPVISSTDGFNPINSRDVTIERSFFRTGDDCLSIKGSTGGDVLTEPHIPPSTQPSVENITIRNCTFWNDHNEVVAIGAETRAKYFRNIRIQDCDVLFHGQSEGLGVFGIIPLHGTEIRDILYEDIRVEHCEDQLFCFRFVDVIWKIPGDQTFPGTISNVTIRNISVGYQAKGPRSEFTGWAADKPIQNVTIEGLRYGAKVINDAAGMGLRTNAFVKGLVFASASVSPMQAATVQTYAVPEGAPTCSAFAVRVDGKPCGVFANQQHGYAGFSFGGGPVTVEITCAFPVETVVIRPQAAKIEPKRDGQVITFTLDRPRKLSVEVNTNRFLFLFADALEEDVPDRADPNVIWYAPGYHDLGGKDLALTSNQCLYLCGGAYLANARSLLIANAGNVRVRGRGVLASCTRLHGSRQVTIEGITIAPTQRTWMNKIDNCQQVTYRNVKSLAGDDSVVNFDGFDVMSGCHHVTIDDVFVRATDDVLSLKHHPTSPGYWRSKAPISDIVFANAVVWNHAGGSIIRIGPETIGSSIERVTVRNVEVIHHEVGSVFEIRTVDGVQIRDVLFENVRVEEARRPVILFDMGDWYKVGSQFGQVSGVYFRDIEVQGAAPQGKIQGADALHDFTELYGDNVRWNGKAMMAGRQTMAGASVTVGADARPPEDTTPPVVTEAAGIAEGERNTAQVYVVFSEPVERESAEQAANYAISGGARVVAARQDYRFQQVILTVTGLTTEAALTVARVKDLAGLPIVPMARPIAVRTACPATTGAFQGRLGWWYESFNPVEVLTFRNRPDRGKLAPGYVLMDYDPTPAGGRWLSHDEDAGIQAGTLRAGQRFWAVRTWMAPVAGTVRLTGIVRRAGQSTAPARARVVKNAAATRLPQDDTVLWDWHPITEHGEALSVTTEIPVGGVIRCIVADSGGRAEWEPVIEYVRGP